VDNESLASSPLPGLLGVDLKVLARQIRLDLGLNPTVLERYQMCYMLVNIHYQIATGEVLSPLDCFWYYLPDMLYRIQNAATAFQLELEHLVSRRRHAAPSSRV
jgi:hypothetical protein